jgi:hypothetical protein
MSIKTIFIIPYRNREEDKNKFISYMKTYLEKNNILNINEYRFVFAHQCDKRPFNRGAMKNIGFLAMKSEYPDTYKDITFIFHDVDTLPSENCIIPYKTTTGNVEHYYGYNFALGGIFAIKGGDFEKTSGFPNFWGWGLEDNIIYDRCISSGLNVDRSIFFDISDKTNIIRSFDGFNRVISKRDSVVYKSEKPDSLNDIKNIVWKYGDTMSNAVEVADVVSFVNITSFIVQMNHEDQVYENYDIRRGNKIVIPKGYNRRVWNMDKLFSR